MENQNQTVIESGNAAIVNSKKSDTIIYESGQVFQLYGTKKEQKVRAVGTRKPPNFEHWDQFYFSRKYNYLGDPQIIKVKRTLKLIRSH